MNANLNNNVLCRSSLDVQEVSGEAVICSFQELEDVSWFRIRGLTRFWESSDAVDYNRIFQDILSSIVLSGSLYCFLLSGDKKGLNFYVGTNEELLEGISETYRSCMPGIELDFSVDYKTMNLPVNYGGVITGYPVDKWEDSKSGKMVLQIDNICRGMQGKRFAYLIVANRMASVFPNGAIEKINQELRTCSIRVNESASITSEFGTETKQATNYDIQRYSQNLEKLSQMMEEGITGGIWSVCGYYMSDDEMVSQKLRGILKASFAGRQEENFETFRCIQLRDPLDFLCDQVGMIMDEDPYVNEHPVRTIWSNEWATELEFYQYQYQTIMSSKQLAVLCRFPRTEFAGFYIDRYVEFDTSMRKSNDVDLRIGEITVPGRKVINIMENDYSVELDDMTRHALIIGITGGGKTNTSKAILSQLWLKHNKPFLVIESAKREYWELMNLPGIEVEDENGGKAYRDFSGLTVFTLGSEEPGRSVKFRMNPFEVVGNVSLQTHIDYLLSTFKASFELYAPMPYILESAVYEIYSDRGWDIIENRNIYGLTEYPTLTDLYFKIDVVTDKLGYNAEVQSNVKAALKARVNSLRIGGKGAMMDVVKGVAIGTLLGAPTVLELEDLGDDDTKSFVIGILLVQLYEYRKSQVTAGMKRLQHVLMIEEAHRLLKNVPPSEEGSSAKGKSVEFFCNMLAEIRSFGQGILIADQIPTKLAPDTIKNTNLKIVHRTVMREDREAMGYAMNMNEEQIDYLSSLRRGCAAVYAEGDSSPKLVMMPLMKDATHYSRKEVLDTIRNRLEETMQNYAVKYTRHKGCMMCENRCEHWKEVELAVRRSKMDYLIEQIHQKGIRIGVLKSYVKCLEKALGHDMEMFAQVCAVGDLLNRLGLTEEKQAEYVVAFCVDLYKRNRKE
jgi:hypothetical protein